jgi:hypothetical protein
VSWLYRIATNVFLDRVRAEGSRRLADADEQDGQGSGLIKELPDPGPPVELEGDLEGVRLCAGRPRTQFAETAGLLVVGVGGALLYGLLPSSPAFLLA